MRALRSAFFLAVPVVIVVACGGTTKTKGQLMVSLQTDMSLPKDVDKIGFQVYADGSLVFGNEYDVGAAGLKMPATMGIVAGNTPGAQVRVRAVARKSGKLVVMSEVITTVPSDRLALLRMPIQWLCSGQAKDDTSAASTDPESADGAVISGCAGTQQCVAGTCKDEHVDVAKLPDFDATLVFGGAPAPGAGGKCLDTLGCFASGFVDAVDATDCTIAKPSGGTGLNVALVEPLTGAGICGSEACLIPLDQAADVGWSDLGNGRLQLPAVVCAKLTAKTIVGVAVTTSCATKTEAVPTCGPWNSSSESAGTPNAPAPSGSLSDAGTENPDASDQLDASGHDGSPPGDGSPTSTCAAFSVDQSACNAVAQTGCISGQQCNADPSTSATGCGPAGTGAAGAPCDVSCGPGLYCLNNVCSRYCCSSEDCVGDGGLVLCQQLAAANKTFFGVCAAQ